MSFTDMFVYKGDYGGLDEAWYNIGGTKAVDRVVETVSGIKNEAVQGWSDLADKVKAPFVYVYDQWDNITGAAKWLILLVVGVGLIFIAVEIAPAIGLIKDVRGMIK